MSAFSYNSIPRWQSDEDDAVEISAAPECDPNVMATYIEVDRTGDVVYSRDVCLILRRGVLPDVGDRPIYALIAEPRDKTLSASLVNHELVMAASPVHRGWYDHNTFRFGVKHKAPVFRDLIDKAFRKEPRAMRHLLQQIGRNPYDSRHDVATAILCDPYSLDPLRKFILGRESYFGDQGREPTSLLAVCHEFESLRKKLAEDSLIQDLIEATFDTRNLLIRYHRHILHKIDSQAGPDLDGSSEESTKYKIFQEIASSSLAQEVMDASINLALAGPENLENFRSNFGSDGKPDGRKLVKHRVRDLYLQIYFNLWRRTAKARNAKTPRPKRFSKNGLRQNEFWDGVQKMAETLNLDPNEIESTAENIIHDFVMDDKIPWTITGKNEASSGELAGYGDDVPISLFLLRSAALLEAGYRSTRLKTILDEVASDMASENFQPVVAWIKARFLENVE